ncbi:diaminopimelate epimerase [Oribacterium sp. KHPX15]|uniref:diaminopimelate epimerase n=1 Tax=Oribacterium sp. KHPX15 TaxID=1855342 RepID=UPI000895AA9E|nr:diaminopimelate epimerase [Oribacterium sp. KHPX15]SDZ82919.1 diaminopimelate epimerase [Oribacterium sp. KHPX15]
MKFTKMQGCGNDYVYVNCFSEKVKDPSSLAVKIADRHYGVGGDGLILIEPSDKADAYMHMFNLDGSEGNMCGNGIRCVAKYIYDHGIIPSDRDEAVIDTKSGLKKIKLYTDNGKMTHATVDMGIAKLTSELPEDITVHGMHLRFIGIDVGNPHAIYFLSDNPELNVSKVSDLDFLLYGHDFETHERFPEKVNSEFIRIISPTEIDFRVWERGSGETLACGTGATASVAAGCMAKKLQPDTEVTVHLIGGDLKIKYESATGRCFMTGPAVEVFSGDFPV